MRILVLSNFYPPYELGGQGRSCQQVVDGLRRRGHAVAVLTSMHGANNQPVKADNVFRSLYLEMDFTPWRHGVNFFTQRKRRERENLTQFQRLLNAFQPNVVFVWGMWNLPRSLPAYVERKCSGRVLYRFAEYWPTLPSQHELYWLTPGRKWFSRFPKRTIALFALALLAREQRQFPLKFEHAYCVSAATRQELVAAGIPVAGAHIIHTGLELHPFANGAPAKRKREDGANLLYAGRLYPEKGVETAIEAVAKLILKGDLSHLHFDIAGSGREDYQEKLNSMVRRMGLSGHISFLGQVPAAEMPALFKRSNILVVPSLWPEPFARVVLEAMAASTVVVAASTGGTGEIVVDGENGLLFAPGDSEELAWQITRLVMDPDLRHKLGRAGYDTVCSKFTFSTMLDRIEELLATVALS